MFITALVVLFIIKLRFPKGKSIHHIFFNLYVHSHFKYTHLVMQFEKNICVFFEKNMFFFRIKNLASKKTLKKCFFCFFQNTHLKEITS